MSALAALAEPLGALLLAGLAERLLLARARRGVHRAPLDSFGRPGLSGPSISIHPDRSKEQADPCP